jgi:outer membrane receptor protein involved in Fe transport
MQKIASGVKQALSFSVLFFATGIACSYAQSRITGSVAEPSGQPLAAASILLLHSKDSSLVKGSVTGKNGQYNFADIPAGYYLLSSSYTGSNQIYTPVFEVDGTQKEITVAPLQFTGNEKVLSEVQVTAKKPLFEQKIDRMVINVAASITSAGSTALEVLQRSPGIVVDYQNNTLSMNGKNGVVVMMNGKISRMPLSAVMQMLAGMPSSNIERIELITTPPANYDAEGNAGYINIVLKTNTQYGTNGSYSLTAGYGNGLITSASTNFNHRKGKINLYGDYSYSRRKSTQEFSFYRKVMNQGKSIESNINTDRIPIITNYEGRLGLDYELNPKTTIGMLATAYDNKFAMDAQNASHIFVNNKLDTIVNIANDEIHQLFNYGVNLNMQHNFSANEKVSFNADYIYYKDKNPVNYVNSYFNGDGSFSHDQEMRSNKTTPIKFWTASVDYSKKLGKKIDMEAGLKGTISRFINEVIVERLFQNEWAKDPELTARYNLKEQISAAYTSFTIAITEKTNAKLGLRYEYTNSNLSAESVKNIVDRQYGKLFPSFFISRTLNENNSVNFSYSRRITRPTFNDMAPFVIFMDPSTFFSGNPALQPSISDALKADYLFKKFIFSLSYTYEADPISRFSPKIDPATNKQTLAAENQKNQKTATFTISLPFQVTRWWNMQNNIAGTWQELNALYNGDDLRISQKNFNINSTNSFSLPKDYSIELSGFYQSGGLFSIYKFKGFGIVDVGIQKKFGPKKGTLRFNINNLTGPPSFNTSVNAPEQNLIVTGLLRFSNTTFRVTYTRNFGNDKIREKRNRNTNAETEQQRVQSNN